MNELVVKEKKYDVGKVVVELADLFDDYSKLEVDENNYLLVEKQRQELTSILDTYKTLLSESEEEYLQPYKKLVEPVKNALESILAIEKKLKDDVLTEKKKAFRAEVIAEFYELCKLGCPDGVIPDFDTIYEEKWYGKPKKTWRELLIKKLQKETRKDESVKAFIVIDSCRSVIDEVKEFLYSKNITFNYEEIEGD